MGNIRTHVLDQSIVLVGPDVHSGMGLLSNNSPHMVMNNLYCGLWAQIMLGKAIGNCYLWG